MRQLGVILAHLALWTVSFVCAWFLRFEFSVPDQYLPGFWLWIPAVLACRGIAFFVFRLFRDMWRYSGARALLALFYATLLSSLAYAVLVWAMGWVNHPRSIIVLDAGISCALVGGIRFTCRTAYAYWPRFAMLFRRSSGTPRRLLIIGAGDAGEMLLREVFRHHRSRYAPVGFLDDDPNKQGRRIHGVNVIAGIDDLARIASYQGVKDVIIAIPSANGTQMRRIVALCKSAGVQFKTIPGIDHLIDGRVTVNQIREVAIEDLLGRDPVTLDAVSISHVMSGKVVMVSGAGGSIGSEICRQVCRFNPAALVLVERAENALFYIHRELERSFPRLRIVPALADVADVPRMTAIFKEHRPVVVFHAAAHKHVPMLEWNPAEGIQNNVFGTKALADLSDQYRVERFVMISTDKAVNPTSVMGTTKRIAEMYVQALAHRSRTRFVTVRFGNVMGSAGSVIPLFREQIARGGPVTVTHPDMKRYFMTIPEASQLVLQAGAMGKGGEIFILDMGEPVKIIDLARYLIELSGLRPDLDIPIEFTGLRPGEKLFEEIAVDDEHANKTRHPKIFVGRSRECSWDRLMMHIEQLKSVEELSPQGIRTMLVDVVPEYNASVVPDRELTPSDAGLVAVTQRAANA